ncbi:MAG: hypothetical protein K9M11_01915 [Candidatus Pacebacteria bacterium]|nr:hypothetical protein [Candidatus Paceibacterota bacterium]
MKPQLERAEALAGEMEEWLPHAADSLRSIDEGCSSSSLNEIRSSYEKAQSVVTHCITVQEIVKRRGPMKGLHVDERRRLFEKYKTQYYPSAQLVCVSISAGYDQTCERLSLVQNQNQLRTIYLPAGE